MAADGLYPFSTQNGQAVPLEIVKPLSLIQWLLVNGTPQSITIPAGKTAWVYSEVDAILSINAVALPAALVNGTVYSGGIFIPANTPVTIEITAGAAYLLAISASGKFWMNVFTQWAALSQPVQTSIG